MIALPFAAATEAPAWLEVSAWSVPALAGLVLFARGRRHERSTWAVVGAACLVIAADKGLDLQIRVYRAGQAIVGWLDPATRLRGRNLPWRLALLGGLFAAGTVALVLLLRGDRRIGAAKKLSLAGLLGVMAYLGLRLLPGGHRVFAPPIGWGVEAALWLAVVGGLILGAAGGQAGVSRPGADGPRASSPR